MSAAAELERLALALAPSLVPRLSAEAVLAAHPDLRKRFDAQVRQQHGLARREAQLAGRAAAIGRACGVLGRAAAIGRACGVLGRAMDRLQAAESEGNRARLRAARAGLAEAIRALELATGLAPTLAGGLAGSPAGAAPGAAAADDRDGGDDA